MKYIASCSFGKDSLAQIIKIKELGLPLDDVIYCEVWFDNETNGEHPLLYNWINTAESILQKEFGIKVKHIKAEKSYVDYFYQIKQKGKNIGNIYGFPYIVGTWCNDRLKTSVIDKYIKSKKDNITQYIGIAYDEPKRYLRLKNKETSKIKYSAVLYENKITENEAFEICKKYKLVSPHYKTSNRGGCWFCNKQGLKTLKELCLNYPELYNRLIELQKDSRLEFKPNFDLKEFKNRIFEEGEK